MNKIKLKTVGLLLAAAVLGWLVLAHKGTAKPLSGIISAYNQPGDGTPAGDGNSNNNMDQVAGNPTI